ncbi:MAG: hypothetical protein HQL35_09510 [Alphaproteobacteria bacterium]|nr:hypothetical protein [Alphaproteobacteria bacterium]
MTPARAIAELIARGDIAQLGGGHVLVTELSPEMLEYLSTFQAEFEDCEDDGLDEPDDIDEASEQGIRRYG